MKGRKQYNFNHRFVLGKTAVNH